MIETNDPQEISQGDMARSDDTRQMASQKARYEVVIQPKKVVR